MGNSTNDARPLMHCDGKIKEENNKKKELG